MSQEQPIVLGLVLTCARDTLAETQSHLEQWPALALGAWRAAKVPAVLETRAGEDRADIERLLASPGVLHVDVVYAEGLSKERMP